MLIFIPATKQNYNKIFFCLAVSKVKTHYIVKNLAQSGRPHKYNLLSYSDNFFILLVTSTWGCKNNTFNLSGMKYKVQTDLC
jgi:hypothetical protein